MARFTLHGMWPSGPCYKVGLMLSLTGTPYDYTHVDLMQGEQRAEAYLAKNRFGKVPCLEDHEAGLCLSESAVILQYLADLTGKFGGANKADSLAAREWQSWGITALASGIYRTRAARLGFFKFAEDVTAANEAEARQGLSQFDGFLDGRDWLVGDAPTIADIDLYAMVVYAPQAKIDLSPFQHVTAWMARLEALPHFLNLDPGLPKESVAA